MDLVESLIFYALPSFRVAQLRIMESGGGGGGAAVTDDVFTENRMEWLYIGHPRTLQNGALVSSLHLLEKMGNKSNQCNIRTTTAIFVSKIHCSQS